MTVDLKTKYLGLELRNPLVAAASPATSALDRIKRLEESGIGAVVLPSLFEEQIAHEEMEVARLGEYGANGFAEALSYFPELNDYRVGPDDYLKQIEAAKKAVSVPVIGSLNGVSTGGWVRYAKFFEEAGADAVELNVYYVATDPQADSTDVEQRYIDLITAVKKSLSIPLAVKIGPYFSAMPKVAAKLAAAGADGLVLFNRFMQPDIDLETLEVGPKVELSSSVEVRLPLRWIAILKGRIDLSLAATTGVHTAQDVIKLLLAGADVTMLASALLKNGTSYPKALLGEISQWMDQKEYSSVEQLKGSMSQLNCPDPSEFERGNYMRALVSYTSDIR